MLFEQVLNICAYTPLLTLTPILFAPFNLVGGEPKYKNIVGTLALPTAPQSYAHGFTHQCD